jgi:hypothetical protein
MRFRFVLRFSRVFSWLFPRFCWLLLTVWGGRLYTLIKFKKVCARLTRHINAERKLPAAALVDTRFEGNMMARVIEAWGGAMQQTHMVALSF